MKNEPSILNSGGAAAALAQGWPGKTACKLGSFAGQGTNWILKKRTAFVGLFVNVSAGTVAVTMPLNAVNGTSRFVVDQTRYVRPEMLDQFRKFGEAMLATGIHAGFKSKIPALPPAALSMPALLTAVTVA